MLTLCVKVWKHKNVWEGFVRCCQRTRPNSFQVLLQLPAPQLRSVFELAADLREPLLHHVQSLTPHQRAHISKTIMTVLEKDPRDEAKSAEDGTPDKDEEKKKRQDSVCVVFS
jgi:symplekin